MNISDYTFVDIFDIPDIMKVRTKTTVNAGLMEGGCLNFPSKPSEVHDDVVKLAYAIYPYVDRSVCRDFATETYDITSTLFVVPHDCRRLKVPIKGQIDSIRERMCDVYCRFPRALGAKMDKSLLEVLCNTCPLNELEASE